MKGISIQRKKKGWTQQDLAVKLRVTTNTVYRWESTNPLYTVDPGLGSLKEMSILFGCTIDELVVDEDSNPTVSAGVEKTALDSN